MTRVLRATGLLALLGLLVGAAFAAGVHYAPIVRNAAADASLPKAQQSARTEQTLSIVQEAWRLIERDYEGDAPDQSTLLSGAIHGLVDALGDPYSAYQSAADAASYQLEMDGSLHSLGMAVEKRDDRLLVVTPLSSSPAQRAGIYPRDHIITIDGHDTASLTLGQAMALLRGPDGSYVSLTVLRDSKDVLPFIIERVALESPTVTSALLAENILYVNISLIDGNAARDLRQALQQHDLSALNGIILDLRNNPGGYLDVAVEMAGLFISDGAIVSQETRSGRFTWSFGDSGRLLIVDGPNGQSSSPVRHGAIVEQSPIIVLVNRGTASAAEVFVAAMQDHGRAVVMGEQTLGKSAVTGDYTLSDGSSLHLTNGQWLSPLGRSVRAGGLMPDLEAPCDPSDVGSLMPQAVQWLLGQR